MGEREKLRGIQSSPRLSLVFTEREGDTIRSGENNETFNTDGFLRVRFRSMIALLMRFVADKGYECGREKCPRAKTKMKRPITEKKLASKIYFFNLTYWVILQAVKISTFNMDEICNGLIKKCNNVWQLSDLINSFHLYKFFF